MCSLRAFLRLTHSGHLSPNDVAFQRSVRAGLFSVTGETPRRSRHASKLITSGFGQACAEHLASASWRFRTGRSVPRTTDGRVEMVAMDADDKEPPQMLKRLRRESSHDGPRRFLAAR